MSFLRGITEQRYSCDGNLFTRRNVQRVKLPTTHCEQAIVGEIDHHQCSRCSATSLPFARALGKGCLCLYIAMYVVLLTTSYLYAFFILIHSVLRPIWLLYIVNPLPNWTQANSY